jgi:hypothetical protein
MNPKFCLNTLYKVFRNTYANIININALSKCPELEGEEYCGLRMNE